MLAKRLNSSRQFIERAAPLHLAFGLMMASGISRADRFRALLHWQELVSAPIAIADDINVQQWLLQHRQPASMTNQLWGPLCLAALNTTAQEASARIFQRVLQESFLQERRASDLLIPKRDLTSIFAGPALEYLEGRGSSIMLCRTVTGLCLQDDKICGVEDRKSVV